MAERSFIEQLYHYAFYCRDLNVSTDDVTIVTRHLKDSAG